MERVSSRNLLFVAMVAVMSLAACKNKKKVSLSGEDPVTVSDFIESFQPLHVPYQFSDTAVMKKKKDSMLISYKVFSQFVPDSVLQKVFDKTAGLKIYPIGRITVPKKESYLLAKAFSGDNKAAFLLCFSKNNEFIAGITALEPDESPATQQLFNIDKRYTISKTVIRKNTNGTVNDGKDVYVLNEAAHNFTLIFTDALDEKAMEVINPIDTMSRSQKFTGDYGKDKRNLVSVRDSKRPGRINFFIHFEKNNGACSGELKGEAAFTSPKSALYRGSGDPCVLQLDFTTSAVTIKEIGGCGSRRGVDCVFEGSFTKKKEIKKPVKKKTGK